MSQEGGGRGEHSGNRITLQIVINGTPYPLAFNSHEKLSAVIESALGQTGNGGRPASDWIAKDEGGATLDQQKSLGDLGLKDGSRVFLSLGSGTGGGA